MIPIFNSEISDGIDHLVKSQSSIAYYTELRPLTQKEVDNAIVRASLKDLLRLGIKDFNDPDLYYNKSILVSIGRNLNDDIFDKFEVWRARHSPKDKPSNLDHNEKLICGHMTGVWAIDELGDIIPDDMPEDKLPETFHLFTNNVIYLHWEDVEFREKIRETIQKIEAKEKFVSMECLFSNFDYGIFDDNGVNRIIVRSQETAHLTKYLRAYGGPGVYRGMRIGRVLRNIAFSGKGYVDRPANVNSIIFSESDFVSFAKASFITIEDLKNGVLVDNHTNTMENNEMSVEIDTLKKELEELKAAKAELEAKLAKADVEKLNEKITDLTNEVSSLSTKLEAAETKSKADEQKLKETEESKATLQAELDAAKAKIAEFEAKAEKEEKEKKKNGRKAQLVEVGVSNEEADKTVSEFEDISDEKFAFIVELAKRSAKKSDSSTAADKALDDVKADDDADLTTQADEVEDESQKVRAELAKLIGDSLKKKK